MLNFGLTELRLVAPRDGWPNPDAGPAASGADAVLEQATVFETVAEAIADCTPGVRLDRAPPRPRHAGGRPRGNGAGELPRRGGRTAILFGPERSGLETEDVALAQAIVTVPINPRVRQSQPRPGGDPARL